MNFGQINYIFRENSDNKMYYDRKERAQALKVNDFMFLLDPKYDSQRSKEEFKTFVGKNRTR